MSLIDPDNSGDFVESESIHPVVTICVESPKDDEQKSIIAQTPDVERVILERSSTMATGETNENSTQVQENEPIDVNLASTCDTSKIFYDY